MSLVFAGLGALAMVFQAAGEAEAQYLNDPYSHIGGRYHEGRFAPNYSRPGYRPAPAEPPPATPPGGLDFPAEPRAVTPQRAAHVSRAATAPTPLPPDPVEAVGAANQAVELAERKLKDKVARLRQHLAAHEALPDFDAVSDDRRLRLLEEYVARLLELGRVVVRDKALFDSLFAEWTRASGVAAAECRKMAGLFHEKASKAEFPKTKDRYEQMARWYEARAEFHAERAKLVIPTDIGQKRRELEEQVRSLEDFLAVLQKDPGLLNRGDPSSSASLAEFFSAYNDLGTVLDEWTGKVLQRLGEATAPVGPPTPEVTPEKAKEAEVKGQAPPPRRVVVTSLEGPKVKPAETAVGAPAPARTGLEFDDFVLSKVRRP